MSHAPPEVSPAPPAVVAPRRWWALAVLAVAQMMIALDATVMTVALPSAQAGLGFPDAERHWVITAYTAAFGGLLLLGGRVGDHLGRARTFRLGLAGFAGTSALGARAPDLTLLAVARGAQGACAALLAPTVLALLATTFTEPRERGRAFAVFGAIAGGGGAVGLVLGGVLTETVGWRGCLLAAVPIALLAGLGARVLPVPDGSGDGRRWDVAGAVLVTGGLVAVLGACSQAVLRSWSSPVTLALLAGGAVLLAAFVVRERRTSHPLLPLRILADRDVAGACLAVALAMAGMLGAFLVLTYVLQVVLGFAPLAAGIAFLPLSAALFASAQVVGRVMAGVAPRTLIVPGLLVAAAGMLLLTRLSPADGYLTAVLPAEILLGVGMGAVMTPAVSLATSRARPRDAGVTAAVVSASQQVGGAVGVSVLNTVAAAATLGAGVAALSRGAAAAAAGGAVALIAAAVVTAVLVTAGPPRHGGTS
ncbi:MFS transporter [Actinomycetospora sp. NBRC 106375]|uniref:MFS transporter n=1 Tax=Actinomycetospora sp. NBRC 106375 TaxID=3032207 RepID=UPI0024A42A8F|nr:MFS transporter [Actinomycetospora sp. NBRC 106375]GLZ47315.1 MFS transporter [Actinomycetospora sp. NBRC 106375]